jgi:hypothetical protein
VNALIVTGAQSVRVTLNPEIITFRDTQLGVSAQLTTIAGMSEFAIVRQRIAALKDLAKEAESSRVAVKAEPLRITREIDAEAGAFTSPITVEIKRLEKLANEYAAKVEAERIAAKIEAERKRSEEERKIREQQAAELNRIRCEQELARHVAKRRRMNVQRELNRIRCEQELARRKKEEDERAAREAAKASQAPATAPWPIANPFAALTQEIKTEAAIEAVKREAEAKLAAVAQVAVVAPTMPVKREQRWEVVDLSALAKARPDLVVITASTAKINAAVKACGEIPGLRIWEEVVAK